MTITAAALLLFFILDPLGNIPVFLSLLKELPPARQRKVLAVSYTHLDVYKRQHPHSCASKAFGLRGGQAVFGQQYGDTIVDAVHGRCV